MKGTTNPDVSAGLSGCSAVADRPRAGLRDMANVVKNQLCSHSSPTADNGPTAARDCPSVGQRHGRDVRARVTAARGPGAAPMGVLRSVWHLGAVATRLASVTPPS